MEHKNKSPVERQLLSVPEISREYNISCYTVRKFIADGLPVIKSGRKYYINRKIFEDYIGGNKNV